MIYIRAEYGPYRMLLPMYRGMDSIHFAPTVVSKSLCWRWTLHCTNESLPLLPQQLDILHTTLQPGMDERTRADVSRDLNGKYWVVYRNFQFSYSVHGLK